MPHGEDVRLPGELHVGLVLHAHRLDLDALGREQPVPLVHLRRQDAARLAQVQTQHGLVDGLDEVVPTSATRHPSAEVIPGRAGTSTVGIASSRASATA